MEDCAGIYSGQTQSVWLKSRWMLPLRDFSPDVWLSVIPNKSSQAEIWRARNINIPTAIHMTVSSHHIYSLSENTVFNDKT